VGHHEVPFFVAVEGFARGAGPGGVAHYRGRRSPRRAAGTAYCQHDPHDQAGYRWVDDLDPPALWAAGADYEDLAGKLALGHLPVSFMRYCLWKRARCLL
jgi:hypothetical protein